MLPLRIGVAIFAYSPTCGPATSSPAFAAVYWIERGLIVREH
jgi:hypothetical protein